MCSVVLFLLSIISLGVLSATGNAKVRESPPGSLDKQFLHDVDMLPRFVLFLIWVTLSSVQLYAASTTRMEVPFALDLTNQLQVSKFV